MPSVGKLPGIDSPYPWRVTLSFWIGRLSAFWCDAKLGVHAVCRSLSHAGLGSPTARAIQPLHRASHLQALGCNQVRSSRQTQRPLPSA